MFRREAIVSGELLIAERLTYGYFPVDSHKRLPDFTTMNIRPLSVLFVTLLLLAACESTDPLVRDAQTSIQLMEYEEALEHTERALEEDPTNVLAHYYRGFALGLIAEELQPPSDRKPYYEEVRESMRLAKMYADTMDRQPSEIDDIDDFIISLWATEHNAGVEIMTDDSVRQATQNPDMTARAHFENAVTIEPDSAISYIVLATIHYQQGDLEGSTRQYEAAFERLSRPDYEDYEFLISLYFMQQRYYEARDLALRAMDDYPQETLFAQFLADSYLETGEFDEAMDMLRGLIDESPNNPQYRMALGTHLYRTGQEYLDQAIGNYRQAYQMEGNLAQLSSAERSNLEEEIAQLKSEGEELEARGADLADQAVEQIRIVTDLEPHNDNAYNILGIIFQNRAASLFDKRNNTRDNQLAQQIDDQARDILQYSRESYERATELNPDDPDYWEALFQIYTTLGMDEEAEEAMERAGLNDL